MKSSYNSEHNVSERRDRRRKKALVEMEGVRIKKKGGGGTGGEPPGFSTFDESVRGAGRGEEMMGSDSSTWTRIKGIPHLIQTMSEWFKPRYATLRYATICYATLLVRVWVRVRVRVR